MPWADTVFQDLDNWPDCVWQDWDDCVSDRFSIVYQDGKTRTVRQHVESHVPNVEPIGGTRQLRSTRVGKNLEYEWAWVRYLDDRRWTATKGEWFDNRWLGTVGSSVIWNEDDKNGNIGISANGLVVTRGGTGNNAAVRATLGTSSGKVYWEITQTSGGSDDIIGIGTLDANINFYPGWGLYDYGYYSVNGKKIYNTVQGVYGDTYTTNDIISTALDMDNKKVWWAKNGVWQASGDPAAGTDFAYGPPGYDLSGTFYPMVNPYHPTNSIMTANFGASAFAYSLPSGFSPLGGGLIDLSVAGDWYKTIRPQKFRMRFDNATAGVSLKDSNGATIYSNGTYVSEDEVSLEFTGADIGTLSLSGSGDVRDIEFFIRVPKGLKVIRKQPPIGSGNFRRPYLEGNPSYVEDNLKYPDATLANANIRATGKSQPHMTFKQPYRYEGLAKMKYRNERAFPHEETRIELPPEPEVGQLPFPDPFPIPADVIPAGDPIPEPDAIPEPVATRECGPVPRWRRSSGATASMGPRYVCEGGRWVNKGQFFKHQWSSR